jgi:hypothetical protein
MSVRSAGWLLAACIVWPVGCARPPSELTLDDIVARHAEARGGREALDRARNMEARLRIVEPAFDVEGHYRVDREGRMRIDIYDDGKRVFTEGFDGSAGWQMGADAEHGGVASADGGAALRHGPQMPVNLLSLHDLPGRGHRLELLPRQALDGVEYYVVRVVLDDGYSVDYFLNPQTFLIDRHRAVTALHPDIDATRKNLETRWSDYREVSGTLRPHKNRQIDLDSGQEVQVVEISDIRLNADIDPGIFEMP